MRWRMRNGVVEDGEIRVQTELSKTMLPMVINPEAEKIVELRCERRGGRFEAGVAAGSRDGCEGEEATAAKTGSVQAKAMEHPMVQRAQSLFHAEIRSVIDLREDD